MTITSKPQSIPGLSTGDYRALPGYAKKLLRDACGAGWRITPTPGGVYAFYAPGSGAPALICRAEGLLFINKRDFT